MERASRESLGLMLLIAAAFLAGCSAPAARHEVPAGPRAGGRDHAPADYRSVRSALYSQLKEWESVGYVRGGAARSGIDCSGFVQLTYLQKFGVTLPRSTGKQAGSGRKVSRKELRAGDLVFFKTGIFSRHVGMYVEEGRFLHVSKKKGVTLSSMKNSYWAKRYWRSRRILFPTG